MKTGTFYVVSTPIGNMEDITLRAMRVLKEVDLIAAEDTRHTIKLLNHYEIKKKMISFHEYSDRAKEDELINRLLDGISIALVSDAGTPLISDPGANLVKRIVENGIDVVPIPGACAAISALSVCGIYEKGFLFEGFLPSKAKERKQVIDSFVFQDKAIILYEAPHRILKTLKELKKTLGGERQIVVAREMTKLYEEFLRGSISDVIKRLEEKHIKGEIVLVIEGEEKEEEEISDKAIKESLNDLILKGTTKKDAVIKTASLLHVCKNRVYKLSINL